MPDRSMKAFQDFRTPYLRESTSSGVPDTGYLTVYLENGFHEVKRARSSAWTEHSASDRKVQGSNPCGLVSRFPQDLTALKKILDFRRVQIPAGSNWLPQISGEICFEQIPGGICDARFTRKEACKACLSKLNFPKWHETGCSLPETGVRPRMRTCKPSDGYSFPRRRERP